MTRRPCSSAEGAFQILVPGAVTVGAPGTEPETSQEAFMRSLKATTFLSIRG